MKEVLEVLVKGLVDNPDKVVVTETEGERSIVVEVRVPEEDLGRVIGKGGRVANSLRIIAKAAGVRKGKNVWVEINKLSEPEGEPGGE